MDYYQPSESHQCPRCGNPLSNWQGKDASNGLFVWAQGIPAPIDQLVDDDITLEIELRDKRRLPPEFTIYSYSCPEHQPVEAFCECQDGVWVRTEIRPAR
ncbi:MAG: hypothetical protein Q8Q09_10295 [Deltaproteobacteria bacterium]|nr:hypothetical protein [Deltaproteobacteria bacterium]